MDDTAAAVELVLRVADQQTSNEYDSDIVAALNRVAELNDPSTARRLIANGLPGVNSPNGAGLLAVWLGAAVESGLNARDTWPSVAKAMIRWCKAVARIEEDHESDEGCAGSSILDGLERLGQGAVAHLVADPSLCPSAGEIPGFAEALLRVEGESIGATWVLQLLRQQSGELFVLHGLHARGVLVRYQNIANCFHLFTLLQGAMADVMPGARRPSTAILNAARGLPSEARDDHAWWHYGQPSSTSPDVTSMVWGEAPPDSIQSVDGRQVLLVWKPIQQRSWDAGFFQPLIRARLPDVSLVRKLSDEEVQDWRKKLGLPQAGHKPWWKFW